MTKKYRFTDFTFGKEDDREVSWKKTKNGSHHHKVKLQQYGTRIKHLTTPNQQTAFYLTRLYKTLQITLISSHNIVGLF